MDDDALLSRIRGLHERIRSEVLERLRHGSLARGDDPAGDEGRVAADAAGDVSFGIDVPAEQAIHEFAEELGREQPLMVVSEGLGEHFYGQARPGQTRLRL